MTIIEGDRGNKGSLVAKVRGPWQRNIVLMFIYLFGKNIIVVKRIEWI